MRSFDLILLVTTMSLTGQRCHGWSRESQLHDGRVDVRWVLLLMHAGEARIEKVRCCGTFDAPRNTYASVKASLVPAIRQMV